LPIARYARSLVFGTAVALLAAALACVARVWPKQPLRAAYSSSQALYSADGHLLRLTLAADDKYRLWTPLEKMAPDLSRAVLLYEDRYFYRHPGVNPGALLRSVGTTYWSGRRRGGSTISMQLARLRQGMDSSSIGGKIRQIASAIWLECKYSKHDILEAYLNLAPYGGNVEGVGAASLIFFGKTPGQLTLPEILTLAVIPQNPGHRGTENHSLFAARTGA
jgi:penicillin-binding protein 1C